MLRQTATDSNYLATERPMGAFQLVLRYCSSQIPCDGFADLATSAAQSEQFAFGGLELFVVNETACSIAMGRIVRLARSAAAKIYKGKHGIAIKKIVLCTYFAP